MGPAQPTIATAILDSGTTGHFLHPTSPAHNIEPTTIPLHVRLPDGSTIASTHTATLTIPGLPRVAAQAHIFPDLHAGALLSVSQLCDNGCTVTFTAQHAQVHRHDCLLIQGHCAASGLWHVPLPTWGSNNSHKQATPVPTAAAFTALPVAMQADLSTFLHAACFSPAISTFQAAIQAGYFTTWPGLTDQLVVQQLQPSAATIKSHQQQQRKKSSPPNLQRTWRQRGATATVFSYTVEIHDGPQG